MENIDQSTHANAYTWGHLSSPWPCTGQNRQLASADTADTGPVFLTCNLAFLFTTVAVHEC